MGVVDAGSSSLQGSDDCLCFPRYLLEVSKSASAGQGSD